MGLQVKRNLPPLLALRAFEAAGRNLSFTRAAAELAVTQGAISRQVKLLEQHLRQRLFSRLTRQVELTDFGATYLRAVHECFVLLEEVEARQRRSSSRMRISIPQSLANLWLLPQLASFTEAHFDVHVDTSFAPVDFATDAIDAAIRLGRLPGARFHSGQPDIPHEMVRSWVGVIAEHLADEILTPVASRTLLKAGPPLRQPADVLRHKLIHVTSRPRAWPDWLRAHGVQAQPSHGPEYGHFFLALEAARRNKGIVLAPTLHLQIPANMTGLACPIASRVPSAGAYYLLYRERDVEEPRIQVLKRWLASRVAMPARGRKEG